MGVTWVLLAVLACLVWYLYRAMQRRFRYWEEKGVPFEKPLPIIGNSLPVVILSKTQGEIYQDLYTKFEGRRYFGAYDFINPVLIVRDPEMVGQILVKDFGHFVDHGLQINEKHNWIDMSLFNLNGNRWRAVRNKIVPTFTTGKLKGMHQTILQCAEKAAERISSQIGMDMDVKDAMSLYSTEVIASVAFGLDTNKSDPKFREMGKKALTFTTGRYLKFILMLSMPRLADLVGASLTSKEVSDYFAKILKDTLEYRKKCNVSRNDFVQLLLQLKEKGSVEVLTRDADDDYLEYGETNAKTETVEITEKMLIAQAYTFIMAGFEAMASSLMFILLELAIRPEIQEKARKEVREVLAKHGEFTYQALKEMTYLEMCMQEAMRLRPLVTFLFRICTKKYQAEDGLVIDEGSSVAIPVLGLHKDPTLWPDPEEFRPERFAPDSHRVPYSYLPFGDGPRVCIGMRFAMLQMKQCTACILRDFVIQPSPKTKFPIALNKKTIIMVPKDPIWLKFTKATV